MENLSFLLHNILSAKVTQPFFFFFFFLKKANTEAPSSFSLNNFPQMVMKAKQNHVQVKSLW